MNMRYKDHLFEEAVARTAIPTGKGLCTRNCPSNIAIVKYWGKKEDQLPCNPSLSYTLRNTLTGSSVKWETGPGVSASTEFLFEGKPSPAFAGRVAAFLMKASEYLPFLNYTRLIISSNNTFPHSSGIASSASAMGALALALCDIERELYALPEDEYFLQKASFLARLGSGSAARSIYDGFVLWGETPGLRGSSDEYAIPVDKVHNSFSSLRDSILIIDSGRKKISSTEGHSLMKDHPYAETRFADARKNTNELLEILAKGDWSNFIRLMEHEALSLHAMMMTSRPGFLLMKDGTVGAIEETARFRKESGIPIGFTLDAGANVHLLYPSEEARTVKSWIDTTVRKYCEHGIVIDG